MVIKEVLNEARILLTQNNIEPREARLLLAYSMGIDLSKLIICETCTEEEYRLFLELISRRTNGEPFAYIIGYKDPHVALRAPQDDKSMGFGLLRMTS